MSANNKPQSLIFILILIFSQAAVADHALPEFHAKYDIEYFGVKAAEADYKLSYTDSGYKFTQKTKLAGMASLFANDTVDAVSYIDESEQHLLLTKHRYIQTGKEKNKNVDFIIDWDTSGKQVKGKITGTARKNKVKLKTETPVWDVLSFQLPLMIEASKDKKNYPYNALLKGKIKTYNFTLNDIKEIEFAGKKHLSLQMIRKDPKRDRQLHLWLLPELNNIPVIIDVYRKGKKRSSILLSSVKFNDDKIISDNTNKITDDDF